MSIQTLVINANSVCGVLPRCQALFWVFQDSLEKPENINSPVFRELIFYDMRRDKNTKISNTTLFATLVCHSLLRSKALLYSFLFSQLTMVASNRSCAKYMNR